MLDKLRPMLSSRGTVFWAACGISLFVAIVHRDALNGAWRGDDLQQLISTKDHSFIQLLFHPRAWQTFTAYFFTPILAGQYQLDFLLFGYNPRMFFLHNLVDMAIMAIFTYRLLSYRTPPVLSLLACIGFLLAMPTFGIASYLPTRHYVAGLFFVIASVLAHRNAYRGNMTRNLLVSAGLFFLALMCKEIFAMTLFYFILRSWRSPAFMRSLTLYPALIVVFVIWRWQMIGAFVGGYSFDGTFIDRIKALACVHRTIFGSDAAAALCLAAVAATSIYHRLFNLRRLIYLVAILLAAYVPLLFATFTIYFVPISALHLAFFPAWLIFVSIAYIATLIWDRGHQKTALTFIFGFITLTTSASFRQLDSFRDSFREEDAQANFIRNSGPKSAIFLSPELSYSNGNIHRRLAQLGGKVPANIITTADDISTGVTAYWTYDSTCRCMARLSDAQTLERLARMPQIHPDNAPIALLAAWQSQRGLVRLISANDSISDCYVTLPGIVLGCPTKDGIFLTMYGVNLPTDRMDFSRTRVHRVRHDGLSTFSPFMQIPWTGRVQWERGVFLPLQPSPSTQTVQCHMDLPLQKEIHLQRTSPLELRGWLNARPNVKQDAVPFAALSGTNGKYYASNLYRESPPDSGVMKVGAHILDANLSRIEPGNYRLLLGIENAICDTGTALVVESP